jgi:hypothetical protein
MKKTLAIFGVVVVSAAVWAGNAMATYYVLPLPRAKHIAREFSEYLCEGKVGGPCTRYSWECQRAGSGGATCVVANENDEPEGTLRCETVLHLVIGAGGFLRERFGKPRCYFIE